jgi:hypothetical protein
VRCIVDLARERRDAECGELLGAGIVLELAACGLAAQELGFEVGIGLLEKLDGLIDERTIHSCHSDGEVRQKHAEGCAAFRSDLWIRRCR